MNEDDLEDLWRDGAVTGLRPIPWRGKVVVVMRSNIF